MTVITIEPNRLSVVGHAGYDKVGYDIVCAEEGTFVGTFCVIKYHCKQWHSNHFIYSSS
ncbi:ribosomal-processing cysteine protease Prp [uncultured Eubacterium sp.]|uniref:ribosomal-processing cysteine protease Prp n=1 Tax=uncultured Eubacterium sp. TaxID=165185 RepID=UPI0015B2051C|nr:ribosomal-processing cysteine protease Prp [uncultured Eubacterium sp.]